MATPTKQQKRAKRAASKAKRVGMRECDVRVKGPGPGRESAVTALGAAGLRVLTIEDHTGVPHNGCRAPKKRRM